MGRHHWFVIGQIRKEVEASGGTMEKGVDKDFTLLSGENMLSPTEINFKKSVN